MPGREQIVEKARSIAAYEFQWASERLAELAELMLCSEPPVVPAEVIRRANEAALSIERVRELIAMCDGSEETRSFDNYRDIGDGIENPWAYPTIAAIGPKGQFAIRHLTPGKLGEMGSVPIAVYQGEPMLNPRYAKRGWVLYEDLCMGKVEGIEADADAWTRWQNLIKIRANGGDLPSHLIRWHPEVERRRETWSPVPQLSADDLRALLPGVEIADDDLGWDG